jgi:4-amino-4-deoxy-L-arabinose transferase-like glycosyltransferase
MPRRDLISLFALALAVNLGLAAFVHEPRYVDDSYYFAGALRLVEGNGFTEPYFWNYLVSPAALPQPGHLYWMPLTSILGAASMVVWGHTFAAARLPLVLAASGLPLLAYLLGWQIRGWRRHAWGAGLLTLFCGFYAGYWATTDSFAVFGLAAGAALLAMGLAARKPDRRLELAAGLAAGLAHLARADGLLILLVGLSLACWRLLRGPAGAARALILLAAGYLVIMTPWLARNLVVSGSPLGSGGLSTVWMLDYNDLFRYPTELTAGRYFAAGPAAIAATKWDALVINLQHIAGEECLLFLTPLVAIGLWRMRSEAVFRPVLLYAAGLYAAMTLVFTFPGPRGGLFHSGAALLPAYMAASLAGLDVVVDWVAARRAFWRADLAKRNFTVMAVVLAAGLTLWVALPIVTHWDGAGAEFVRAAQSIPDGAVVMSNNPPGLWVATRHPGIPLVTGGLTSLLAAADRYSAGYLLLDSNHTAELDELYQTGQADRLRLVSQQGAWKLFEVLK